MQKKTEFEIERRFLIRMPDIEMLEKTSIASKIVQNYLLSADGETARVRMRETAGNIIYTHTVKKRISAMTREEKETEINREEYERLLSFSDPQRNTIKKTRYCLDYRGKCFEIDVFSFFTDRAIIEIELSCEEEEFELPPGFSVIREITGDKRYTNASMALCIPLEEI